MKKYLLLGYLCVFSTILFAQTPPVLTAAISPTVDGTFFIEYVDDASWETNITSITYNGTALVLTTDYTIDTALDRITFDPSGDNNVLQIPHDGNPDSDSDIVIVATGFDNDTIVQSLAHGVPTKLGVETEPLTNIVNGSDFSTQPVVEVQDQYGNRCTGDGSREITVAKADGGAWILNGTLVQNANTGTLSYTDLSATSNVVVSSAQLSFSADVTGVNSATFNIPLTSPPPLTAGTDNDIDSDIVILFTDDGNWADSIQTLSYRSTVLTVTTDYVVDKGTGTITLKPGGGNSVLQTVGAGNVEITANTYSVATVSQTLTHGAASQLTITTQPAAPGSNGGALGTQPVLQLKDQYSNICTTDDASTVTLSETGDGTWTVGGTNPAASSGIITFTDLTASSNVEVANATITFGIASFTLASDAFAIPVNPSPVLTAATDPTVDANFNVGYVNDVTWETSITSISYNGVSLVSGTDYTIETGSDFITFIPSGGNSVLQTPHDGVTDSEILIVANGYANASIDQNLIHGAASQLTITTQPAAPGSNGGALGTQPVLQLKDQYSNNCTTDGTSTVTLSETGDGTWTVGGTNPAASSGIITFTDLTASSNVEVANATITFGIASFTLASNAFAIPVNPSPVLTAATDPTVDANFNVGYVNDVTWETSITSISYNGVSLVSGTDYTIETGSDIITFIPSGGNSVLQTPHDGITDSDILIVANGYANASIDQNLIHGAASQLTITTQPAAPVSNGGTLGTQPVLQLKDQYSNNCTTDDASTVTLSETGDGTWTVGGTNPAAAGGIVTYTDLTATSNLKVDNATITFGLGSFSLESNSFVVDVNEAPSLTAALGATVDDPFEISYGDNTNWESNIDSIKFNSNIVPASAYSINSTTNKITFTPAADPSLQTAVSASLEIFVATYAIASVTQEIGHGVAAKIAMQVEPVASAVNGDPFTTQPIVEIQDQYDNICTTNSSVSITASEDNPSNWTLGGAAIGTVTSGVLVYTDLTASSTSAVTNAYISFTATGLTGEGSATFNLGQNTPPSDFAAAVNATVDGTFIITFTNTNDWQTEITSVTYDDNAVDAAAIDTTTDGQITFDPSLSTALQVAGTNDFVFVSSGFSNSNLSQAIGHGVPTAIKVNVEPTAPASNGGLLVQQPEIISQDQYLNTCTGDNATAISVAKGDTGDWTLGGSPNQTLSNGSFTYTDLSATSDAAVSGAFLTFSSGSFADVNSANFDIPVNAVPSITEATNATVDNEFSINFNDDATWRGNITDIQYDGNSLPALAYDAGNVGRITFKPAESAILQVAGSELVTIISSGYANAEFTQEIGHGSVTDLFVSTQPVGPNSNGGSLVTQPIVHLHDQYDNICTTDNTTNISSATSGGTWTLGGTGDLTSSAGVFTFTDLTASSDAELTTATITFSAFSLTDVVSTTFTIPSLDASPTLLASSVATVDGTFEVTFSANATWQLAIDSIRYDSNLIDPAAYDNSQSGKIILDPSLDSDLQVADTKDLVVYAQGYANASVSQEIKHGAASSLNIVLEPSAPAENGALLANQPAITIRDQYGNDCTSENTIEVTAAKGDTNDWTLGGTMVKQAVNGSVSYSDLTASSSAAVTGAFIAFSASGLTTVNSTTFDIPDLTAAPVLTAATGANVDEEFTITFTENAAWRDQITEIKYGTEVLPVAAYDATIAGQITFKPAESTILQAVANEYLFIVSTSFLKDSVQQEIAHGAASMLVITTQPFGPQDNGDEFRTQPIVKIQDQYLNDCTTNNEQEIEANATGGSWIIDGTNSIMVTNGIAEFTDLTARSIDLVSDATITFSGTGLTSQESDSFLIPAPLFAPSLISSTTATVDSLFDVTFSTNADWQGNIDSISYGGTLLSSDAFDKTQSGKIVFDPSKDVEMQVADTKEILVYSRGFQDATVDQQIKHGIPDTLLVETQPEAPLINGGTLDLQPKVSVRDQYDNACSDENAYEVTVVNGDGQNWTLGGMVTQAVSAGVINYKDLSVSSELAITGAFLSFTGAGITSVNSDPFDIPALQSPPNLSAQFDATVDADFELGFFGFDDSWPTSIETITYEGDTLPSSTYDIESDKIVFHVSEDVLLQKAGVFNIAVKALGYSDAIAEQTVGHGVATSMIITQQPLAPPANGDLLAQQPILEFYDQYSNLCDSDNERIITVSRNDEGIWDLAGTLEQTAVNGLVTFDDLSAFSTELITGAEILFSSTDLNGVVSDPFDIPDVTIPPVLTAAVGATVDNSFKITFVEDSVWRNRINVVTVNDSVLVSESYNFTIEGELELIPSASEFLQTSGSFEVIVQSRGFSHDTVQQDIQHGLADSIMIVTQPVGPELNGDSLVQQPELKLSDQYLNDCTTDNETVVKVEKFDQKAWVLAGTLDLQSQEGIVNYTDLTATSEIAIDSAYLQFSFSGDTVVSSLFSLPVPIIELTAAADVTVDNEFTIQASDNASWRDSISAISFAGETLVDSSYLVEAGNITFYPSLDSILQIARTDTIVIVANGYANAIVEQIIEHGVATEMVFVDQPIGPENNGDTLAQQPSLQLKDQYDNNCDNDNATQVLTAKYSDGSDTDVVDLWDLGGIKTITAIEGLVKFLDLTATSENRVEGARLLFTSDALPNVVSDSFDIVIPPPPVIVGNPNANVDESFFVEFTDNKTWRSLIDDIRYGIRSLEGRYDISVPGRITFDPTVTSILQKSGVDSLYIYSQNYDTVRFEQVLHHGKSKYLVILKEPSAPLKNGENLLRQPQLQLQDQYRNYCESDNETPIAVKKGDDGDWTLSGTFTQIAVEGLINYTDLAATSEMEVEGARLEFEGTGIIPKMSHSFTIPEPQVNRAGVATANPELVCYGESASLTLVGFDGVIQWQKYIELDDVFVDVDGEQSEIFITDEVVENGRYRAMVSKEGFATQYSNSVTVSPIEAPIADFTFEMEYNNVEFTNLSVNATSIVWDFGDGLISSDFDPSHSFVLDNVDGTGYTVTLTATNEACPASEKQQQIFITTGINDLLSQKKIAVYPNPSRGEFFVELSNSNEDGVLRIFDQAGKVVATRKLESTFNTNRIPFDLSNLNAGVYFLTIQYSDRVVRTKLIIQ